MKLNELETQILLDIYEMDINHGPRINMNNYELKEAVEKEKRQEFVSYLQKLKRFEYIEYEEDNAFRLGGIRSTKYRTNVCMIWSDEIHISKKGIELVEEIKKTVLEKIKEKSSKGLKVVYEEAKEWGTKTIAEIFTKSMNG